MAGSTDPEVNDRVRRLLDGAVDLHVHPAPSPFPRRIGIRGVAEQAAAAGFRAILVKSHHHSMLTDIAAADDAVGGLPLPVYGGVALNNYVGGINPHAVDLALQLGGRMVWFPTVSSGQHICVHAADHDLKFPSASLQLRETVRVPVLDDDGALLPQVVDVLELIRDADAIMSTGHLSIAEIDVLVKGAHDVGVRRIVVNHPNFVIQADPETAARWTRYGAVLEHGLCQYDDRSSFFQWGVDTMLEFIRVAGIENTMIGSDLGQKGNPLPVEAYAKVLGLLSDAGLSDAEIRTLVVDNPGRVLGI